MPPIFFSLFLSYFSISEKAFSSRVKPKVLRVNLDAMLIYISHRRNSIPFLRALSLRILDSSKQEHSYKFNSKPIAITSIPL